MEVQDPVQFSGYMKGVRRRTLEVAAEVPPERETWRLEDSSWSPAQILHHVALTEQALWGSALATGHCGQVEADPPPDLTMQAAVETMARIRETSRDYWCSLDAATLGREIVTPAGKAIVLRRWLVLAAEHEIHHRSFIHAYRKLWGLQSHPIYGLTYQKLRENLAAGVHLSSPEP